MSGDVCVILPVRDGAEWIAAALQSVLAQADRIAEICVIEDGSRDGTPELLGRIAARQSRLRVIAGDGRGPAAARNLGLAATRAPLVAFIDADDLWPPGKLDRQLARLDTDPALGIVSGLVRYFSRLEPGTLTPDRSEEPFETAHVNLGAAVFRRAVFDAIGTFDEALTYSEDVDLLFRAIDAGIGLTVLPEATLWYRRHPGQMTHGSGEAEKRDFRAVMARTAIRRRRLGIAAGRRLADFVETSTDAGA
ncbi:MAG: glycosyltransferase family 2 protein [Rubricella sp.]